MSSVVIDSFTDCDGRVAEREIAAEVVINEARHEGVLVEQDVALDVTATYDEAKPQDLRLRAQSKDEEDKVALDGAKPRDRRLRAQSKGRDDKVAHDGAKPQDLQRRARSNGREAL